MSRVRSTLRPRSARSRRASSRNDFPASVRRTPRVKRSKSAHPISSSSCRIWRVKAGCTTCSRSAAWPKCSSSPTATKYRRCRSSTRTPIAGRYQVHDIKALEAIGRQRHRGSNACDGAPRSEAARGGRKGQPQAPQVYVQPEDYYYCESAKEYYPYVKECPQGWTRIAPQPTLRGAAK